jgi:hypothetical protein
MDCMIPRNVWFKEAIKYSFPLSRLMIGDIATLLLSALEAAEGLGRGHGRILFN